VLLFGHDGGLNEAELGYLVGAPHRGRGLASRALGLLSAYGQEDLKLARLLLRIDPDNAASCAVARRCGYRRTAEKPILHEGVRGPSRLDTWELMNGRGRARLRNVTARRYGRR